MKKKNVVQLTHNILAKGEATGHAHRAEGAILEQEEEIFRAICEAGMTVTHEEHAVQVIPPSPTGSYRIGQVQVYDHVAELQRNVAD